MPKRVVLVSDGSGYVGPDLALLLAEQGHDLVVGDPRPGLVDELAELGAAVEVVVQNVQINVVGTNFMDFPEFLRASRAEDPEGRARVDAGVPMGRLGTLSELADFALPFIDGQSRFTTGQFVAFAGGWA